MTETKDALELLCELAAIVEDIRVAILAERQRHAEEVASLRSHLERVSRERLEQLLGSDKELAKRGERLRELAAETASLRAQLRRVENCGQDDVCATPPGCLRHWEERNRELVVQLRRVEEERNELRHKLQWAVNERNDLREGLTDARAQLRKVEGAVRELHGLQLINREEAP